jgi:ABC-2 type transport system ATP-binding protein
MEQVEQLCDDICLMARGEVVLQGNLRDVKKQFGRNTVILEFDGDDGFVDVLEAEGAVRINTRSAHRAELTLTGAVPARHILETAMEETDEIYRFERVEPPLSEIFVDVVGEDEAKRMQEEAAYAAS